MLIHVDDGSGNPSPVTALMLGGGGVGGDASQAKQDAIITAVNATTTAVNAAATDTVAHDAVDIGEPLKIGGKAIAAQSAQTMVAANDRSNAFTDLDGSLLIADGAAGDSVDGRATNIDGASTLVLAAGAVGIKHCLSDITIANSSATAVTVDILDGATIRWTFPVPAGGGVVHSWKRPLRGTAATAWNFDPSAAATTITCSVSGFKSKL